MKMKKFLVVSALTLASALTLFGCGSSSSDDVKVIEGTANNATSQSESSSASYVFSYKGTDIAVDADAADIIDALGEPNSYSEAPSCAAQGIDKLYSYNDFDIETYPDGDNDLILYVRFKSDAVSTQEGINLSSTRDDIIAAYGEPTKEVTGSLVYDMGDMKLVFVFDGDSLISIEYDSPKA